MSFAKEGANVIVCDFDKENAIKTTQDIKAMGTDAMEMVCDVRDGKKVAEFAKDAIELAIFLFFFYILLCEGDSFCH